MERAEKIELSAEEAETVIAGLNFAANDIWNHNLETRTRYQNLSAAIYRRLHYLCDCGADGYTIKNGKILCPDCDVSTYKDIED